MRNANRREFLKTSALAATATFGAAPALSWSKGSPNDRVRVAVCGVQGRGEAHIKSVYRLENENVELAAMCDCHEEFLAGGMAYYKSLGATGQPKTFSDMRKLFEDKSIDAVTFATPNHWHALGTIWACQAGKDVYVEKPGSQKLSEGRKMVEVARQTKRIVQHGTQCRSSVNIREGISKLQAGAIGRVYMARVVNYKRHFSSFGRSVPGTPPPGLNWDMWVGPGPETQFSDFNWQRYNYRWDFGVGDLGNQGVHQLDIARWGLGLDTHPSKIQAMGGNFFFTDDDSETPCLMSAAFQFGDQELMMTAETRDGYTNSEASMGVEYPFVDKKNVVGVIFLGTEGFMVFPDYSSYHTFLGPKRELGPSKADPGNPMMDVPHFRNWVQAIRSRNPQELNSEILEGHYSSSLCHLANIAYRTGKTVEFDPSKEKFVKDSNADALLSRKQYRAPYSI